MQVQRQDTLLSEINVTPFVDVMLVLLIIFMVTAPMMVAGLQVDLPETRAANLDIDQAKLMIVIDKEGSIYLDDVPVPEDRLEEVLTSNERIRTEKEVYLKADESLAYGMVVKVMGFLREAGVINLNMVTNPMEDSRETSKSEDAGKEDEKKASGKK